MNSDVLYVKGMNAGASEDDEDIWDDQKLNEAYDRALKLANLEVAKRVAMATNSGDRNKDNPEDISHPQPQASESKSKSKKSKQNKSQKRSHKTETKHQWKEGMPCRAVYNEDGFEYEAILVSIIDEETCVIRYLGYNNTEMVPIASLQPTLGKEARRSQVLEAAGDEDPCSSLSTCDDEGYQGAPSQGRVEIPQSFKKPLSTKSARKRRSMAENSFPMPGIPMPDAAMLRDYGQMDMPIPPPPLVGASFAPAFGDDSALSNMLISWYMSGYYTGLYQGMRRSK